MKLFHTVIIVIPALLLLFFQTNVSTAYSAEKSMTTKEQKNPEKNKDFFSFFKKISPKNILPAKKIKIVNMDSVVDYMKSKGIKAKPMSDENFAVPFVMQLSNAFSGYKIQNYILMEENEEVVYGVFEFSTKIQAEASVERVKSIFWLFFDNADEDDVYAKNIENFVVAAMKSNTKIADAIKGF